MAIGTADVWKDLEVQDQCGAFVGDAEGLSGAWAAVQMTDEGVAWAERLEFGGRREGGWRGFTFRDVRMQYLVAVDQVEGVAGFVFANWSKNITTCGEAKDVMRQTGIEATELTI
ncbi:MAG: hypothetical protein Q8R92_13805 [Deltaproteobacteria bacterium]|nr:hypothetical protein [Deltaproteobacteria bacterium]